jgi:ribose transport system substrate-binding protein
MNRRDLLRTTGAAIATTSLAGCGGLGGGGDNSLDKIGMSAYVRGGSWITAYIEAAEFYAEQLGVEIEVRPNQQSAQKQVEDIRDFTNGNADAILAGVWSTGAAEGAVNQAIDQGTPVFATNADTSSEEIPLYVGFSNYDGGASSGEEMVSALDEQYPDVDTYQVLNVRGPQGNQSANQRSQGFVDVIDEQDNIEILETINGEFARDQAQQNVQEYINANGEPHGIYSANLSMGLGVVQALDNLNLLVPRGEDNHVVLTQMDGSPEVNPLVGEGMIDAAVDQPNYFYNPVAMQYIQEYVEAGNDQSVIPDVGDEVTSDDLTIESGEYKGVEMWSESIWEPGEMREQNGHPWFRTNSIVITEENFDQPFLWGNVWG